MKRIKILVCILGICFAPMVLAQLPGGKPVVGRHVPHRIANQPVSTTRETGNQFSSPQEDVSVIRTWELGTYPGGTWAALGYISDSGVALGLGDVPPLGPDGVGYTHTLALSLFGPRAGEWIDLGTLGGELPKGWEEPYWLGIANTGLVATHSTMPDGQVHAAYWTRQSGMLDLGTLANTGDIKYKHHNSSYASAVNRLGTLIVGWSGVDGGYDTPVVWTPSQVWNNGTRAIQWNINALDTKGFSNNLGWQPGAVNDYGQIIGFIFDKYTRYTIPVLWNPLPDGHGWTVMELPYIPSSDYPYILPFGIDDKGNVIGAIESADGSIWLPQLWNPLNQARTRYSKAVELPLPAGFIGCEAVGINELGDITGDCYNDVTDLPTRWILSNPTLSEILKIPGDWGLADAINNNRVVVLTYGGGSGCPGGSCGGAIQLH